MNKWAERAADYKDCLKQLDEWLGTNWSELPEGVKRIICRGQNVYTDKIEKYEEWAKEENQAE